jgi:hypothetical protein
VPEIPAFPPNYSFKGSHELQRHPANLSSDHRLGNLQCLQSVSHISQRSLPHALSCPELDWVSRSVCGQCRWHSLEPMHEPVLSRICPAPFLEIAAAEIEDATSVIRLQPQVPEGSNHPFRWWYTHDRSRRQLLPGKVGDRARRGQQGSCPLPRRSTDAMLRHPAGSGCRK